MHDETVKFTKERSLKWQEQLPVLYIQLLFESLQCY